MKTQTSMVLYSILFIIGLLLFCFAVKEFQKTRNIISNGIRVDATLIEFETVADSDGDTYKPIYEFKDNKGIPQTFTSPVAYAVPKMKVGDIQKLVFVPNDVNKVKIDTFWGMYLWSLIFSIFAFPLLIIGGGYLIYTYT